jgi:hypothetical protein
MGYTHYWRRQKNLPARTFALWADDVQRIINTRPLLTDAQGFSARAALLELDEREFSSELVSFNGKGELGHETFFVPKVRDSAEWERAEKGLWFDFCKTARKPYDVAVVASLIAFKLRFPKTILSSDGHAGDLIDGRKLASEVLGNVPPIGELFQLH